MCLIAWSVALCSDGKTYASTGASGGITIHSAVPSSEAEEGEDSFGTRLTHLSSGRSKFGLDLKYSPVDSTKVAMSNETGQVILIPLLRYISNIFRGFRH